MVATGNVVKDFNIGNVVAHKEIIVDDVVQGMTENQAREFLKFRAEMCESKALNRALRTAMQIKGTYYLEEFKKPFVVAYLVPNLDNPTVKEKAVESFFTSKAELYGGNNNESARKTVFVSEDPEEYDAGAYEAVQTPIEGATGNTAPATVTPATNTRPAQQSGPADPNICTDCGAKISNGVSDYSIENYGTPLCMNCQRKRGNQ